MQVLKFGGTSIGSSNQIKKVVSLINLQNNNIVVFSALSDVTNLLSEFIQQSNCGNLIISKQILKIIEAKHLSITNELLSSKNLINIAIKKINASIKLIEKFLDQKIKSTDENLVLAQ